MWTRRVLTLGKSVLCLFVLGGLALTARADQPTPLIPRDVLFGNPEKAGVQISPDGKSISFLAPVNNVLNVWVGPVDNLAAARAVTKDTHRGIRNYFWAFTSKHVLYIQDKGGNENWHIYSVSLDSGKTTDLTPFEGVQGRVQQVSRDFPSEILVGVNNRNPQFHDIYRVNITTGKRTLVEENSAGYLGYITDDDMKTYFAVKATSDGGSELYRRTGANSWTLFTRISSADMLTTNPVGLDKSRKHLFMLDSRGRNTAALTAVGIDSGDSRILAQDPKADIAGIVADPINKNIQAVQSTFERRHWQVLDDSVRADFAYLKHVADGEFNITSRTKDDSKWIVAYVLDAGPVRYYLYNRHDRHAKFLFTNQPKLAKVELAIMHPVTIKSRDGLDLVSYYTLPVWADRDGDGKPNQPLPMVLFVHGGPWARDNWGYNPYHQWLANRGYAVLSVNYRGSTGFGKQFVNAGNFEWAGKMHDDLLDAVDWTVKQGIAERDKVAIMGGSYGGYATLVGLTFTPDTFACGVDIVGPSNLKTLFASIPPYWKPMKAVFATRVGDDSTEAGRKLLTERSPLTRADRIVKPLLIGQGANDPRVNRAEADQIVNAMKAKHIPVTYVLYPDEGHGFARPSNRMSFNAVAEVFLSDHLGGRFEPLSEDIGDSSITVPAGAKDIKGLQRILAKHGRAGSGPT